MFYTDPNPARQAAIDCLVRIVENPETWTKDAIGAASLLLSPHLFSPGVIVDEGDAPYIPCDCPVCDLDSEDWGDDLPGDNDFPIIFTYGVFSQ